MALNVAILGCGNMGTFITDAILRGEAGDVRLHTLVGTTRSSNHVRQLAERAKCKWLTDPGEMELSDIDLIIEAAGQQVVKDYMLTFLKKGKHIMLVSVGALSDMELYQQFHTVASKSGSQVILPSGAIGGLDAIRSAALAGLESVELITKKPPNALQGAPYVVEKGIDLDNIKDDSEIFSGNALEAAEAFPANLNVAMALSLAGIGPERTKVRIVVSPDIKRNTHEVSVVGAAGVFELKFENLPSPENPKTSHLATLSVLSALKGFNAS